VKCKKHLAYLFGHCLRISCREQNIKICSFQMATKLKGKRISSTKVREHYLTFDNFPNPLDKFSVVTTFKQPHIFLYQRKAVPMDNFECELFQVFLKYQHSLPYLLFFNTVLCTGYVDNSNSLQFGTFRCSTVCVPTCRLIVGKQCNVQSKYIGQ
jgi:hypothetical protein